MSRIQYMLRAKHLLFITIMLVSITIAGCQSTPDEEIVANKADSTLNDKIYTSSVSKEEYIAPGNWSETLTFHSSGLTVNIDATIEIPNVDAFPVVKITPHKFDNADAKTLTTVLLPEATLYIPQTERTKQEIENEIVELQLQLTQGDLFEVRDQYPEEWSAYVKEIEQAIEELEKEYSTAPDSDEREIATLEFEQDAEASINTTGLANEDIPVSNSRQVISVEADLGGETPATLQMWTYDNDNRNFALFLNHLEAGIGNNISINIDNLRGVNISLQEAEAIAIEAIDNLGLSNMQIAVEGSNIVEDQSLYEEGLTYNEMPQCYVFYFTRNIGGIQTTYESQAVGSSLEDSYAEPWQYEMIEVCVNDSGIIQLYWGSPAQVTETVNENVVLLSFDEIQELFREQIGISAVYTGYEDEVNSFERTINITNITLGMMRIKEKDSGEYLMIPVWDFFGCYTDKYPDDYEDTLQLGLDENNEITFDYFAHSLLTINAIDGSIIDRGLGY